MSGTRSTTTEDSSGVTTLAQGLKNDRAEDSRDCLHSSCHGELTLTDGERVVCRSCRCTPDGIFLMPQRRDEDDEDDHKERYSNSNNVILPGGHEKIYDETYPAGGTHEYVFDISTY